MDKKVHKRKREAVDYRYDRLQLLFYHNTYKISPYLDCICPNLSKFHIIFYLDYNVKPCIIMYVCFYLICDFFVKVSI